MATDPGQILDDHEQLGKDLVDKATQAITTAAEALSQSGIYTYVPYQFTDLNNNFIGGPTTTIDKPSLPKDPSLDKLPSTQTVPTDVPDFTKTLTTTAPTAPSISIPGGPSPSLPVDLVAPTTTQFLTLPTTPVLVPVPDATLPYPTITVPTAPAWSMPTFSATAPAPIQMISLPEYLAKLDASYAAYAQTIPNLVQSNWRAWYALLLADHPLLSKLLTTISNYLDTGGAGIPTTIEDAITTRAQDKVAGEARRARQKVFEDMDKRGLWLPSGALVAGLKESAQIESEATSKAVTDLAIKHLDIEHDHMKFMMSTGRELEAVLCDASMKIAEVHVQLNLQAIDITKTVLTGMLEIQKAMVQIYLAEWEGFRAAVAVYQAQIQAIEAQVQVYEAQIRAELAKTEINKAKIAVIESIVNANRAVVEMYKAQIEGQTALLEIDRVKAVIFEAQTRAYVAQVDGYRAQFDGYRARVEGEKAKADVYAAQVNGYKAQVEAYTAEAGAYGERVRGIAAKANAVAISNKAQLEAWTAKTEGQLKAWGYQMEGYKIQWESAVEQMKIQATYWQLSVEELRIAANSHLQQQLESGREHLTQWTGQLEGALRAAQGLTSVAQVSSALAEAVMSGVTSLAATTETIEGS